MEEFLQKGHVVWWIQYCPFRPLYFGQYNFLVSPCLLPPFVLWRRFSHYCSLIIVSTKVSNLGRFCWKQRRGEGRRSPNSLFKKVPSSSSYPRPMQANQTAYQTFSAAHIIFLLPTFRSCKLQGPPLGVLTRPLPSATPSPPPSVCSMACAWHGLKQSTLSAQKRGGPPPPSGAAQ